MTDHPLLPFQSEAAQPLTPLEHIIISPQNLDLEQRRNRAIVLTKKEFRAAVKSYRQLQHQLVQANYADTRSMYLATRAEVQRLADIRAAIIEAFEAETVDEPTCAAATLWTWYLAGKMDTVRKYRQLDAKLRPVKSIAQQAFTIRQRLIDHHMAIERDETEQIIMKRVEKESKVYEKFIVDRWTRLGFAHKTIRKGKTRVKKVKFARVNFTLDAIYYEIDASYKTAFGGWKTNIPDDVYVVKQLLHPDTLDELTVACKRRVTAVYSEKGAWVIVHRLEAADGLMNYVTFDSAMEYYPHDQRDLFPICVGVGQNRKVEWLSLVQFPHWLIGGYTNSGKSNMVNVLIATLIKKHTPMEVRLALIDLKGGLEFSFYDGIPHLDGNIVDDIDGVEAKLNDLENIMRHRFRKFRGVAKTLEQYHARCPGDYMPRIICVFDEVASIMDYGDTTKRIIASLRELCRMGRAVGIHIMLCTQRPDVRAVDGNIKANLAVRLSGRMVTSADSVTVLGNSLAKELAAIPGRMVLQIGPDPKPIQTPHITAESMMEVLQAARLMQQPPTIDLPTTARRIHQRWTAERVIEFSINHMNGSLSGRRIYDALGDHENVTAEQMYRLVEQIWAMPEIVYQEQRYLIEKTRGGGRKLVPAPEAVPQLA